MTENIDMMELSVDLVMRPTALAILEIEVSDLAPFEVSNFFGKSRRDDTGALFAKAQPEKGRLRTDLWVRWKKPTKEDQVSTRLEFFTQRRYDARRELGSRPRRNVIARSKPLPPKQVKLLDIVSLQLVADIAVTTKRGTTGGLRETLHGFVFFEPPSYDWDKLQDLCTQFQWELDARSNRRSRAG